MSCLLLIIRCICVCPLTYSGLIVCSKSGVNKVESKGKLRGK